MKHHDAIVIGASLGGLVAAAYLARAGKRVLVLEREAAPSEAIGPVYGLDPVMLSELRLPARGLTFVQRDLPLSLPGPRGEHLFLGRDRHQAARALAAFSAADARAWASFRHDVDGLARQLRGWWWSGLEEGAPDWVLPNPDAKARFARLSLMGADAFLAEYFESDAVIAALLFDASVAGLHVSEPGSALALVWRAAQEMAGLQGAAAMPAPGTLVWPLVKAADAADFRCCATVRELVIRANTVRGVKLDTGEEIETGLVLSSLGVPVTLALTGVTAPMPEIGEARLLLSLREKIAFPPARLILAEGSGLYADAFEAARAGRLADELPMEFVAQTPDRIAVMVRPVPALLGGEDRILLAARVVQALSRQVPGAARLISGVRLVHIAPPRRAALAQLLAPSAARVKSTIAGLYLCGADAEPLASISGRAARIAARHALKFLASQK